jgi:hypothetical protein
VKKFCVARLSVWFLTNDDWRGCSIVTVFIYGMKDRDFKQRKSSNCSFLSFRCLNLNFNRACVPAYVFKYKQLHSRLKSECLKIVVFWDVTPCSLVSYNPQHHNLDNNLLGLNVVIIVCNILLHMFKSYVKIIK